MSSTPFSHFINQTWDESILPCLMEYIKIPNKSPQFDKDWQAHGFMQQAANLLRDWCQANAIADMKLDIKQLENRTPIILIEIPGSKEETILLYGHFDKQPEMSGWDDDLQPFSPVRKGDKLYGRGAADDGYAIFASLTAINALQREKIPHARVVILIEGCEESGSIDLPYYIEHLQDTIANPNLIICLDSGCGNYDQLWLTTSLRGMVGGILQIDVLSEGIHSGMGSGTVPSCTRILRQLLNRLENEKTGDILPNELHVTIPADRMQQINKAADELGEALITGLPFIKDVQPETANPIEVLTRRTWRPALSVIGLGGMPAIANAGNVTLPCLTTKLSMRLPPTCHPEKAAGALKAILEKNPPYHAKISFTPTEISPGWNAPPQADWLTKAMEEASQTYFGKGSMFIGEGGSIPFMGMLGKRFPQAQFMITGVLGPHSNAHGPNEFLHIPTAKKLTACVASVIAEHFKKTD